MKVKLFLDSACVSYPVAYRPELQNDQDSGFRRQERMRGRLEVSRNNTFSWMFAFVLGLVITGFFLFLLGFLISLGCSNFTQNIPYFEKGAKDLASDLVNLAKRLLPADQFETFKQKVNEYVSASLPSLIAEFTSEFKGVLWQGLLFFLYLAFWLSEPLPVNKEVADLFKAYIILKSLVCVLFGFMMGMLLLALGNPLWPFIILMTTLLNYIPEVGAVLSALICLPVVLLDGHQDMPARWHNTLMLVIFGSLFKIITGNIIEVRLYASTGGQFMRMHPVVLMAIMMLCAALLGLTGMFLTIPITATVKYFLLCSDIPPSILDPVLKLIEGEEAGPYMNALDSERVDDVTKQMRAASRNRTLVASSTMPLAEDAGEALRASGERPLLECDERQHIPIHREGSSL